MIYKNYICHQNCLRST